MLVRGRTFNVKAGTRIILIKDNGFPPELKGGS